MHSFKAAIDIIGINPFVPVPGRILSKILKDAGKDKGKIPVHGTVNSLPYKQTLVRYRGDWRLYINTSMLKNSPRRIGETIKLTVEVDTSDRTVKPHPKLLSALNRNKKAKAIFHGLSPSLRHEIMRYINNLKTDESVERNVIRAIDFLLGKAKFVGRENP